MCLGGKGNGSVWWDEGEGRLGSDILFFGKKKIGGKME